MRQEDKHYDSNFSTAAPQSSRESLPQRNSGTKKKKRVLPERSAYVALRTAARLATSYTTP